MFAIYMKIDKNLAIYLCRIDINLFSSYDFILKLIPTTYHLAWL